MGAVLDSVFEMMRDVGAARAVEQRHWAPAFAGATVRGMSGAGAMTGMFA